MKRLGRALGGALLALALPALLDAGTIQGRVVDDTGGALPGATVTANGPGGITSVVTGGEGGFSIDGLDAGTYKVTGDLIGFQAQTLTVTVPADGTAEVSFTLGVALRGEEVVVTASRVETAIVDAPATISVIGSADIQNAPVQNFGDILRNVPGLNVIQTSARDVQLSSRQSTSTLATSTLVLVDGRTVYLDFFGFVLWDLVPTNPNDIKQIEVVRGPASAVWGANALTGVVNVITKTPRENPISSLTLTGGTFDRSEGSRADDGDGTAFGGSLSIARAPSDTFSFRLSGGYYDADPYSRPTGIVPVSTHPLDSSVRTGGAPYPADQGTGLGNFENDGTKQPKVELRIDQELSGGGRLTYSGGWAGTEGIIHTGIGPFNIENGSFMGYGRVGFTKDAWKVSAFANFLDADAPNLLLTDPLTGQPVQLNFKTQTFDFEIGHSTILGGRHVLSYGGNARRNNFDISLTPAVEDRNEFGAYLQDEFFVGDFRLSVGARIDKFGNLDDPNFSPRVTFMYKPSSSHAIRVSFNRAFRSPSAVNNYLDQKIAQAVDLRALAPFAPPGPLRTFLSSPFGLIVNNVGSEVAQYDVDGDGSPDSLKEEQVDAYEISYSGTFGGRTTIGIAAYQNDTKDNINFTVILPSTTFPRGGPGFDVYTPQDPPPGVPAGVVQFLTLVPPPFGPIFLPKTAATYLNLGPLRNRGVELSLEHSFSKELWTSVNYSWQDTPERLDPDPGELPYPVEEVGIPSENRVNAALNWNTDRFFGNVSLNYSDEAFWVDVLGTPFSGATDSYTMVNAALGLKWADGKIVTTVKAQNLFNDTVQQHIFGDLIKRSIYGEVRFEF